jgi:hypothetical protein
MTISDDERFRTNISNCKMNMHKNSLYMYLWYRHDDCFLFSVNLFKWFTQNLFLYSIAFEFSHVIYALWYSGVMVSVIVSSGVDRGFELRSGQTRCYDIGMCCFSVKHAALKIKCKDWFTRGRDNVSEWGDMSIRGLLCQ